MINGYDDIYENKGFGGQKKYKLLTKDDLVHNLGNCIMDFSLGITATEAYVSIMEQQIGQDEYRALIGLYTEYRTIIPTIVVYQAQRDDYKNKIAEKQQIETKISDKIKQIEEYKAKLNEMLDSADESTKKTMRAEYDKFRQEIAKETDSLNELTKKLFDVDLQLTDLKVALQSTKQRIMANYERLGSKLTEVNNLDLSKFNKFEDSKFEEEVEQDFVDSCLLPDETHKEEQFRQMADAKFEMMKMEARYLLDTIDASEDLVAELKENNLKTELPQEIIQRHSTLSGMELESTTLIEDYDYIFTMPEFNEYYQYIVNICEKSNYGENWSNENIYEKAIELGIPIQSGTKFEHFLGKLSGKIKTEYGYDMELMWPMSKGLEKMQGGVEFDFSQLHEQEAVLRV